MKFNTELSQISSNVNNTGKNFKTQNGFWDEYLANFEQVTEIPKRRSSHNNHTVEFNELFVDIHEQTTQAIYKLCDKYNFLPSTFLHVIWGIFLQKYTNSDDVLFARKANFFKELDRMIPLRIKAKPNEQFLDIVQRISKEEQECNSHLGQHDNGEVTKNLQIGFISGGNEKSFNKNTSDISTGIDFLVCAIIKETLSLKFLYNQNHYSNAFVNKLKRHFIHLLQQVIENPLIPVEETKIITRDEEMDLLQVNNKVSYPTKLSLCQIFREQANKNPYHTALSFEDCKISYKELDQQSDKLASSLINKGVSVGSTVGLMVERSLNMIVSILGILKAGAAYVPIDPNYPNERIKYMLSDSNAQWILTSKKYANVASEFGIKDEVIEFLLKEENLSPIEWPVVPSSTIAYIIYTSGSTGKPKGILTTHSNIIKTVINSGYITLNENDKVLQLSNYAFDGSTFDIFGALLNGSELVLVPQETMSNPLTMVDLIRKKKITVTFITTALFNLLIDLDISCFKTIRKILFGGENASYKHVQRAYTYLGEDKIIHVYGPTETTVFATYYPVGSAINEMEIVPIGRPINNTDIFILDKTDNLQPVGIPGEICIGGSGLAKGYLNRQDLTDAKFVDNPYLPNEKMYRTGDLGRWTEDGNIEFINRIDHQVKIRGHRIELGEIEKKLLVAKDIKEAIVTANKDQYGHSYLCAYYVADRKVSVDYIKKYLTRELPEYMVPDYFVELNAMPLTPNGKINRNLLPSPIDLQDIDKDPPQGETEKKLHNIWKVILTFNSIGRNDSFFNLGGQSLKAMSLIAMVKKEFGVSLPLKEIFNLSTIQEIANYIDLAKKEDMLPLVRSEVQQYYPVSSGQKSMFTIQMLNKSSCSYNITSAYRVKGEVDKEKLNRVFESIAQRQESLRTSFHFVNGELVQKIHENVPVILEEIVKKEDKRISEYIHSFIRPFDLSKAPLFRVGLLEIEKKDFILVVDIHHIIFDGVSLSILNQEISKLYSSEKLKNIPIQYKDYAVWQRELLNSSQLEEQGEYWGKMLRGELPLLSLPTDYQRPPIQTFNGGRLHFSIGEKLRIQIQKEIENKSVTLFMYLVSVYHILLSKTADQDDIIIGSPLAGRIHSDLDSVMGMFVNTLPLRNKSNANQTFNDFLASVKENVLGVLSNSEYPFEKLIERIDNKRDTSRNPIFDTMLILQNMDLETPKLGDAEVKPFYLGSEYSRLDISWEFYDNSNLDFCIEFSKALFKASTIERMAEQFIYILNQVINDVDIKISDIELVNGKQREQLLFNFNNTQKKYPSKYTIQQLFEKQVHKTPDFVAVKCGQRELTYAELNQKANVLAKKLRLEFGVERNDFVGILMDKSIDITVAVLGVLKSGAAYIPIDPTYPLNRITYMIEDSQLKTLLINDNQVVPTCFEGEILDLADEELLYGNEDNLPNINDVSDLAYMIYTSGSTGNPKGVMIEHQGLANFSLIAEEYGIREGGRVLQFAPFSFDASVAEIFHTLLVGATLFIEKKEDIISNLIPWIKEKKITSVTLPPSLLRAVNYMDLPDLKTIVTAGEACSKELVEIWGKDRKFINAYGPTEATIGSTLGILNEESESINIGKPIFNKRIYILNPFGQLQPIGVPGELCIGGIGLARGYWNRLDMTNSKFIDNPFVKGEKIYKTGDLARWLPDGTIEFLGRIDYQVKINGHRIELEEVQQILLQHTNVSEAAVIDWKDKGRTILCGYVSLKDRTLKTDLKAYLKEILPDYMIPSFVIDLPTIPLTPNNKIDRKALPTPENATLNSKEVIKPTNALEELLVNIWEEVLNYKGIGINDNFLEIGGDSIKGIQIAARMNLHNFRIEIKYLYEFPTIAQLAPHVKAVKQVSSQEVVEGPVPLTPIQEWFFAQGLLEEHHWNQSIIIPAKDKWEYQLVDKVFTKLVEHHDALRMSFHKNGDQIIQINEPGMKTSFNTKSFEVKEDKYEFIKHETSILQKEMNLKQGDLVKVAIFKTDEIDYLFITIHHLVIDGVSWRILLEDFHNLYNQSMNKQPLTLPMKTDSYKEWSNTLQKYTTTEMFERESRYWDAIDEIHLPNLPKDNDNTKPCTISESKSVDISLSKKESEELISKANKAYNTDVNDVLLSALLLTMKKQMGLHMLGINLEGHGREELLQGINVSRTVGWFTSIFPVVFEIYSDQIRDVIKYVKERLRDIPNKGVGYGIRRYLNQSFKKKRSVNPEINFNYLGIFEGDTTLAGIGKSKVSTGDAISPLTKMNNSLDINGVMVNGELHFNFRYNPSHFNEITILKIAETYRLTLLELHQHCTNAQEQVKTKSDFSAKDIEQDELESFLESLS
ncbi:non-ribosomal peptide synthetase [Priestia megaterium]|uniref:non-ribosomal peptide synthetase n=1 Tax=Priestia megaterium TaxID=1404 RepID=UPI00101D8942|nr:non-ribosomal peptide synthetase [Priestia megaterium]